MPKLILKGAKALVSIKLSFAGTLRNHLITVENQHIPTTNDQANNIEIVLDGDPIRIYARFVGTKGTTITNFEVSINGETGFKVSDIKFKYDEIEITVHIPYSEFKLKEKK